MAGREITVNKNVVRLNAEQRNLLAAMIASGKRSPRLLTKARILLKADVSETGEGWSDSKIAEALDTTVTTIERTRRQFVNEGFDATLTRQYNPKSGPMPPALATHFTTGELAALRIVTDEVRDRGDCRLHIAQIAARAGVGETTTRNALRRASREGFLTIEERRRDKRPNLSNVVRIVPREWTAWIERSRRASSSNNQRDHQGERLASE